MKRKRWYLLLMIIPALILGMIFIPPLLGKIDDKGYKIGISNGFVGNNWRNQMLEGLDDAISVYREEGLISEVYIKNAGEDVNNQILQIKHLIDSQVDLLLIDPNSRGGLDQVISEARSQGILVVVYDQNVSSQAAVQLTIDQEEWGARLGEWLGETLNGQGNIILMSGVKNQPCNIDRVRGIMTALGQYPDITILDEVFGNWDQATAKKQMTEVIYRYPQINGILSQDGMALGVLQAYEAAGLQPPAMTGETMNAFMEKSVQISESSDFQTFALTNPPGIGASALSLGLYILSHDLNPDSNDMPRQLFYPVRELMIRSGKIAADFSVVSGPGTQYQDEWMNMDEIEAYFFPQQVPQ